MLCLFIDAESTMSSQCKISTPLLSVQNSRRHLFDSSVYFPLLSLQVTRQRWHQAVWAVKRSGAFESVSSMSRSTTSSSCWRTASSSCAWLGQTGPWPSSGTTLKDWKRCVLTHVIVTSFSVKSVLRETVLEFNVLFDLMLVIMLQNIKQFSRKFQFSQKLKAVNN